MSLELNRETVKAINSEAIAALNAVAVKHGLSVTSKGGKFGPDGNYAMLKFMFTQDTTDGTPMTPEFIALRNMYPEVAGYEFYHPQYGFVKPIGYNARARKFPIHFIKMDDLKTYSVSMKFLDGCTLDRRTDQ